MLFWKVTRPICAPVIRAAWRVRVTGREHIPRTGPGVLASNHLSILDHFLLPLATKRPVYYLSKAEHFDHRVRGWLFKQWGAIPLRRGTGDKGAVEKAQEKIREGHLFGIYPEGTRSQDGRLYKGHTGVARIAMEGNAPIIPCAMIGSDKALPKGASRPRFSRCEVRIGPPIDLSSFEGEPFDYDTLRVITDQVMLAIQKLSGQEYTGEYHAHPAYERSKKTEPPSMERAQETSTPTSSIDGATADRPPVTPLQERRGD